MNNYKLITIILLISSIDLLSGSDSKFKKLSFEQKITKLTQFPAPIAHMVSDYLGFFKITGYKQTHRHAYHAAACNPNWPPDAAAMIKSKLDLATLMVYHPDSPNQSPLKIALQKTDQVDEATNDIRCIARKNIVPNHYQVAAVISPDNSKLIVLDPLCPADTADGVEQRIFIYPIDYNDTKFPKPSSCCSVS